MGIFDENVIFFVIWWYTFLYHLYNVNKRCHPMRQWNVSMDGEPPGTELLIQTPIIYVLISTKNNFKIIIFYKIYIHQRNFVSFVR